MIASARAASSPFPFVGFHHDIARGAYVTPDTFCRAVELAGRCGYTHYLPYLENLIRLPSMAKACPPAGYGAGDWRRVELAAREAGVELVPHFNVIGHTADICRAYPELAGDSRGHQLDPELAVTREWMLACLDEYCQFSTAEYFLIGGDEWQPPVHLLARPGFEAGRAWAEYVNLAVEFLHRRGRRPIVWHDMMVHHPAALKILSREAVIAFWFYDEDSDYPFLALARELGFRVIMASGLCSGLLERRRYRAVRQAIEAAKRHQADGFAITTWSDGRWEKQQFNIPAVGAMVRGDEAPAPIVDALSLVAGLSRIPAETELAGRWQASLAQRLVDPAWLAFPDLYRVLRAASRGDRDDELASYLRYHHPSGPLHDWIRQPRPAVLRKLPAAGAPASGRFGLETLSHPRAGQLLRFHNGPESFAIIPRYGAVLHDWRHENTTIVPSAMESLPGPEALPGGYRSYASCGGFRPIWGLGTHSNPCILWQHPFAWQPIEQTAERVAVALELELGHVAVRYEVGIRRGQSGFQYRVIARNKLPVAWGGLNFNLILAWTVADLSTGAICWEDAAGPRQTSVEGELGSSFWVPMAGPLTVSLAAGDLRIEAEPAATAGYFVDWSSACVTPDLHGVYRRLTDGEETSVTWRLAWRERTVASSASERPSGMKAV